MKMYRANQPRSSCLILASYGKKYTGATLNAALQKLQDGEIAAFVVATRWPLPINGQKVLKQSISPNKAGAPLKLEAGVIEQWTSNP